MSSPSSTKKPHGKDSNEETKRLKCSKGLDERKHEREGGATKDDEEKERPTRDEVTQAREQRRSQ
jgi:hypothetical protein